MVIYYPLDMKVLCIAFGAFALLAGQVDHLISGGQKAFLSNTPLQVGYYGSDGKYSRIFLTNSKGESKLFYVDKQTRKVWITGITIPNDIKI